MLVGNFVLYDIGFEVFLFQRLFVRGHVDQMLSMARMIVAYHNRVVVAVRPVVQILVEFSLCFVRSDDFRFPYVYFGRFFFGRQFVQLFFQFAPKVERVRRIMVGIFRISIVIVVDFASESEDVLFFRSTLSCLITGSFVNVFNMLEPIFHQFVRRSIQFRMFGHPFPPQLLHVDFHCVHLDHVFLMTESDRRFFVRVRSLGQQSFEALLKFVRSFDSIGQFVERGNIPFLFPISQPFVHFHSEFEIRLCRFLLLPSLLPLFLGIFSNECVQFIRPGVPFQ
uniref:Uncharacterized protein n=1 Tax=Cacopsylla melanoneura TaxID=428564 RepID=A0A8D8Z2B3_9HEMI